MSKVKGKTVYVGLSGGVDSSVSAVLLKKAGYRVVGVFIKVWQPDFFACTSREDRLDAMRVCAKLKIPFKTLNLEAEYKKEVVDYMIKEYQSGRTPNPDVMCNRHVKFGHFFDWAIEQGADYVATGHYARTRLNRKTGEYDLLAGQDKNKDQSYFLWTLNQRQLSRTLFPIGELKKTTVRSLAKRFDLITSTKKDSQGLCFIGKVELVDFLKHFVKLNPGAVLNSKGEIIGQHIGSIAYTLGQRHGFTLTKSTPHEKRHFVVQKDLINNTITVDTKNKILSSDDKIISIGDFSFNTTRKILPSKKYQARIRYRQPLERCTIEFVDKKLIVRFEKSQQSPTPGQSIVFYDGPVCLGGGIIL